MNASNAKDYLPLVQALAEGKVIQGFMVGSGKWEDMHEMQFNGTADQYRIKPEPKEFWVNRYADDSESLARFSSARLAEQAANTTNVTQVRYREVIE